MDKLVRYLIDYSETLIGCQIRPSEEVLKRNDAALYIWKKMGMKHEIMRQKDPMNGEGWRTLAPASHIYVLDSEELDMIKKFIDRVYIEFKRTCWDLMQGNLWYLIREKTESGVNWVLYIDNDNMGFVSESDESVEYPTTSEEALINLIHGMKVSFPDFFDLCSCVVLPFGCRDSSVWQYAGMVTLLGNAESGEFKENVVAKKVNGEQTSNIFMIM